MVQSRTITPSRAIAFADWHDSYTYKRWQDVTRVTGGVYPLRAIGANYPANTGRTLEQGTYTLLVDGVPHASAAPAGQSVTFALRVDELTEGWHFVDIQTAGETVIPWWVLVDRGGPAQSWVPVQLGSYDSIGHNHTKAMWACRRVAPPRTKAMPARTYPHFSTALTRGQLVRQRLVPREWHDMYVLRSWGAKRHTCNTQYYTFSGLTAKAASDPSLDGPRGVGTVGMPTHLQVGRNGKIYFCESRRVGVVHEDGTVRTLAGFVHTFPAPRRTPVTEATALEDETLVGDWSSVPPARRRFHELWGMTWDARTLTTAGPPIDNGFGVPEDPHVMGPRAFVADSQMGRICALTFLATVHGPAKVTEYITGLNDPWDCAMDGDRLFVSERGAHRILEYQVPLDGSAPTLVRVVVSGAALAHVTDIRTVVRDASLTAIRAEQCVLPEGLFLQDGWLFFGSLAMQQVRRVNLSTGVVQVAANDVLCDGGSNFFKIAVSDGTFGPRGAVFVATFASAAYGNHPVAYLPDGNLWNYNSPSGGGIGPGEPWESAEYVCSVGVGDGRMVIGPSHKGLYVISKALPTDAVLDWTTYDTARDDYIARGLHLTAGQEGWGSEPLPWGASPLVDAHLQHNGWTPGD